MMHGRFGLPNSFLPLIFMLLQGKISSADLKFNDNSFPVDSNQSTMVPVKPMKLAKPMNYRLELSGYIGSNYTYLVVDIEAERYFTGTMSINGNSNYVQGEKVDGVLHIYDQQGKHYTIINQKLGPP